MTTSNDIEARYATHMRSVQDRKDQAVNNLITVFRYLKQHCPDLDHIKISYSGGGDSGQVEDVTYVTAKEELLDLPNSLDSTPLPLDVYQHQRAIEHLGVNYTPAELLDDAAWDVAYGQHPGFEINEGGYGTVHVGLLDPSCDVATVRLEHHKIVESTNDYEHNFTPSEASA